MTAVLSGKHFVIIVNFVSPTEPPNPTSDTEPIDKDMIWAQLLSCRSAGLVKFFLSLASFSNIKRLLAWCTDLFFPLDSIYMVRSWHSVLWSLRLQVVPHFSSGIVERAKRERAWKSAHARKGDTPRVAFSRVGWFSHALACRSL